MSPPIEKLVKSARLRHINLCLNFSAWAELKFGAWCRARTVG